MILFDTGFYLFIVFLDFGLALWDLLLLVDNLLLGILYNPFFFTHCLFTFIFCYNILTLYRLNLRHSLQFFVIWNILFLLFDHFHLLLPIDNLHLFNVFGHFILLWESWQLLVYSFKLFGLLHILCEVLWRDCGVDEVFILEWDALGHVAAAAVVVHRAHIVSRKLMWLLCSTFLIKKSKVFQSNYFQALLSFWIEVICLWIWVWLKLFGFFDLFFLKKASIFFLLLNLHLFGHLL